MTDVDRDALLTELLAERYEAAGPGRPDDPTPELQEQRRRELLDALDPRYTDREAGPWPG